MSALDHRMSSAELDELRSRLDELHSYALGTGQLGVATGIRQSIDELDAARSKSRQARVRRRMPKTIFGKPTNLCHP